MAGKEVTEEEKGYLQRKLDAFINEKWIPFFNKEENKEFFKDDGKPFTLQKYIDKWAAYNKANDDGDDTNGHWGKMDKMPVIGSGN